MPAHYVGSSEGLLRTPTEMEIFVRKTLALSLVAVAAGSLAACGPATPDTSSAQAVAASVIRLAAQGETEAACSAAVTDWQVRYEGIYYTQYGQSPAGAQENCREAFTQFGEELRSLDLTPVASKVAAEDIVVRPPDGRPFQVAHTEEPYISVQVAQVGDQWLVNDFDMRAGR